MRKLDLTLKKVLEEIKGDEQLELQEFRRRVSFIRFNKKDADSIIKALKRENLIEVNKSNGRVKITPLERFFKQGIIIMLFTIAFLCEIAVLLR